MKDVATSDEFPINVKLRISGPIFVLFDLLSDNCIIQNIDGLVLRES